MGGAGVFVAVNAQVRQSALDLVGTKDASTVDRTNSHRKEADGGRKPAAMVRTPGYAIARSRACLKQLSDQTATLVRQELDFAKAKQAVKGKKAGLGAGISGPPACSGCMTWEP